jgi:hypothetical protein
VSLLELPYEDTRPTFEARALAHYYGGGGEKAKIMSAYLGRPFSDPNLPTTREEALKDLNVLGEA